MGLKDRFLELLGVRTPIVQDPAAEQGRAPAPGELQPEIPDYPTEERRDHARQGGRQAPPGKG